MDGLRVVPANEASWEELRAVFGTRGQGAVCWCQRFKLAPGEAFKHVPTAERAERLRAQAGCGGAGATSGLVAFRGGEPVGWCAVEPRCAYPGLARVYRVPWAGRAEVKADASVWAVTCFFVRAGFRRQGVSYALARATVGFARAGGGAGARGLSDADSAGAGDRLGRAQRRRPQHLRRRGVPGGEPSVAKAGGDAGGVWYRLAHEAPLASLARPRRTAVMPKTVGEEMLARLARASFLKPWTFPNLFYKKGKELADLVIRYGNVIIIFSEKGKEFNLNLSAIDGWLKWKTAIDHSIRQILGAERQIITRRPKLFLDSRCHAPAPAHLFEVPAERIYRVAVVRGSGLATQMFFRSDTGSLAISSESNGIAPDMPFAYNPYDGNGRIFHVLDDYTFRVLFKHIDTAPDLINYLDKKEFLLRQISRFDCHGEEELIQHYLRNVDSDGEHGFEKIVEHARTNAADSVYYAEDSFAEFEIREEILAKTS